MSAPAAPQSDREALALALWLALTAPSPEREALAVELAETLSARMTARDVRAAKRAALRRWGGAAVSAPRCRTCDGSGYDALAVDEDGRAVDCPRCSGSGVDPFVDLLRSLLLSPEQIAERQGRAP